MYFPYVSIDNSGGESAASGVHNYLRGYHDTRAGESDDGLFAQWRWDGKRLEASCDWLGVQPLFYGFSGTQFTVSPSVAAIVASGIKPVLDMTAIGVFLRLGFFLGTDTPYANIKSFPPAGRLVYVDGQWSVQGEYPACDLISRSAAEECDGYIDLFRNAVAKRICLHGDFVQPLSGGRDSRHILAELVRQNAKPHFSYTIKTDYAQTEYGEEGIASQVAERLRVKHRVLTHRVTNEVRRECLKNVLTFWR